ncbi:hypothetical protein E4U55_003392 [Claviceps digitariae]|nr:hypothetical protein E4U55_003392 [Claviceps digitariae]
MAAAAGVDANRTGRTGGGRTAAPLQRSTRNEKLSRAGPAAISIVGARPQAPNGRARMMRFADDELATGSRRSSTKERGAKVARAKGSRMEKQSAEVKVKACMHYYATRLGRLGRWR